MLVLNFFLAWGALCEFLIITLNVVLLNDKKELTIVSVLRISKVAFYGQEAEEPEPLDRGNGLRSLFELILDFMLSDYTISLADYRN